MNRAGFLKRMAFAITASAFIDLERLLPRVEMEQSLTEVVHEIFTRSITESVRAASPIAGAFLALDESPPMRHSPFMTVKDEVPSAEDHRNRMVFYLNNPPNRTL